MDERCPPGDAPLPFPALPSFQRDASTNQKEEQAETVAQSKSYSLGVLPIRKRRKPQRWTEQDTQTFYTCLEIHGMNFRMFRSIFSPRTLRQILRKFHKEKKKNPEAVDKSLAIHESNKISFEPGKPMNFLDGFLNQSHDSDQLSCEQSDESLNEVVRHKLMLQLESSVSPLAEETAEDEVRPLEYYLALS